MECPACQSALSRRHYHRLYLEVCPSCRGIWTDGEEIEKMATFVKGNPKLTMLGHALIEDQNEFREEVERFGNLAINVIGLLSGLIPW